MWSENRDPTATPNILTEKEHRSLKVGEGGLPSKLGCDFEICSSRLLKNMMEDPFAEDFPDKILMAKNLSVKYLYINLLTKIFNPSIIVDECSR